MDNVRHPEAHTVNGNIETTLARDHGQSLGTAVGTKQEELAEQIRMLRAAARVTGERIPGRPALATATGATEHQVRKVLDEIAREEATGHQTAPGLINAGDGSIDPHPEHSISTNLLDDQLAELIPTGADDVQAGADDQHRRRPPAWPLVIIGLAAAISVWSGWVGLGQLAGFGMIQPLPGVWDDLRINTAVVLPISVEAYAAYALRCWLTARTITPRARNFARRSAITSLVIGAAAQIAFHLMTAAGLHQAPWPVTVGVATIPVIVLGLATALANLIGDARGGAA